MITVRKLIGRIRSIPGLKQDIAAVAVLVVVGIAATAYAFSKYGVEPPWSDRYTFAAEFETAPGVRPESRQEVRIAGVTAGRIESAEPMPNGHARVVMSLDPGQRVYSNAHVVLRTKAPLNIMYVAVDPGRPPGKPLPAGGLVPVGQTERAIQPYEVLNKLDERTRNGLTSLLNQSDAALASAPAHLPSGLQATDAAANAFRPVLQSLDTRRDTIAELVTALSQIATAAGGDNDRLARLTSSLQQTLSTIGRRDGDLGAALAQIPGFTKDLNHAMTSTGALTSQLNPTLRNLRQASGDLPEALTRLRGTVETANGTIDAAAPVIDKAKPVAADLKPLAHDLVPALGDLRPTTGHLPGATARIAPWMNDLAAFVYQTSSAFSISDANHGFGRANIHVDLSNPTGGLAPMPGTGKSGGGR